MEEGSMIEIVQGDCLETLRTFPDACIDAVVTDPPYGLSREPNVAEVLTKWLAGEDYQHRGGGFMGKSWDSFVPGPAVWREALRVLKPGGHLLSFFGTRTYDLGTMAIRLAGFEIRDQLAWMYGTGFPKSKNVAMSIDKGEGIIGHRSAAAVTASVQDNSNGRAPDRSVGAYVPDGDTPGAAWAGWGTALKPAQEPIVLARKPLAGTVAANVLAHGTGGINVDGCRIGSDVVTQHGRTKDNFGGKGFASPEAAGRSWVGRWPANVLLDEAAAALLDEQTASLKGGTAVRGNNTQGGAASYDKAHAPGTPDLGYGDSGGASRFFYCAKASKTEREAGLEHLRKASAGELTGGRAEGSAGLDNPRAGAGRTSKGRANTHPTVKPVELMRYLVRLVTPPGGIVLDPYNGSGTTGIAAKLEGFRYVGLELSDEYVEIARARIEAACG
jgi:site-specific DNA-methyltransferase (adenine-specific)